MSTTEDCSYAEPFALQVLGDSMEPEFPDKCVIVIAPADACYNGAFVVAEAVGDRWFRQYIEDDQGNKKLVPLNGQYPVIQLKDGEYKIEGVIIQRNIKRQVKHYHPQADNSDQAYQI